jgi:single-stranded DNA-binding protein
MNKAVLVGRLTRDPEVRYSQGDNTTAVARYTVAVDLKETANRQRILFRALYSAARQSLRKNIFVRACGFLFPVVFRQEATRIKTV